MWFHARFSMMLYVKKLCIYTHVNLLFEVYEDNKGGSLWKTELSCQATAVAGLLMNLLCLVLWRASKTFQWHSSSFESQLNWWLDRWGCSQLSTTFWSLANRPRATNVLRKSSSSASSSHNAALTLNSNTVHNQIYVKTFKETLCTFANALFCCLRA